MGYTGGIQRVIDCSNLESPGVFSMDFLWRGLAIRGHVCCNVSSDVDIHPSR